MSFDYGIEIECIVPTNRPGDYIELGRELGPRLAEAIVTAGVACAYTGYTHTIDRNSWKIVTDGSLVPAPGYTGLEIVSPPMTEANFGDIERVCAALKDAGAAVNRSCGLHVHVGARNLSINALKKLAAMYAENEDIIDSLLPTSRRQNNNNYCRAIKGRLDIQALHRATSVQQIAAAAQPSQDAWTPGPNRYSKLNFAAYWKYGTVEFRHHSGTVDATKIKKWIVFCCKMVDTAVRHATEPVAAVRTEQHPYWRKTKRARILLPLLTRPEGVTRAEAQAVLGTVCPPNIREHLARAGASTAAQGRRNRMEVFRLANQETVSTSTEPTTLSTLLTRLELTTEDRDFWIARAVQLAADRTVGNSTSAEVR